MNSSLLLKKPWEPKKFVYEAIDEALTASAGLGPLIDAFVESPEFESFKKCLPERIGNSSYSREHLALILLAGLFRGEYPRASWFSHPPRIHLPRAISGKDCSITFDNENANKVFQGGDGNFKKVAGNLRARTTFIHSLNLWITTSSLKTE